MIVLVSTHANRQLDGGHFCGHLGYRIKLIFELGREFDRSNPYMKYGSNWVINDLGRVSTSCKLIGGGHFVSPLSYRSSKTKHI